MEITAQRLPLLEPEPGSAVHGEMVASRMAALFSRYSILLLGIILLAAAFGARVEGHRKPLWYDEIFSVIVATQPSWQKMKLAMPADGNPPLLAFLIRACIRLFGHSDFVIRLPSLLGFLGALAGVFVFVRRECGPLFGLLAAVLLLSEPGWTYSFEARPYALLIGFMMLGLVSWQAAARAPTGPARHSRVLPCLGIFIALAGSILSHHIGVIEAGFPLLAGEAVRTLRRRRMDWPVLASAILSLPILAWTYPMARRTNALLLAQPKEYASHLALHTFLSYSIETARGTFPLLVSSAILGVFALVLILSWAPHRFHAPKPSSRLVFTPGIMGAALGATLLIPVTLLLMMSSTGYYNCRYGIGSIAGIALLASLLLRKLSTQPNAIAVGFIAALAPSFLWPVVHDLRHPPAQDPHFDAVYNDTSGLPIVVSDPFRYVPLWWYAPPAVKSRLYYLKDPVYAIHTHFLVETALVAEQPLISAHLVPYQPFVATHSQFILDQTGTVPPVSMKDRLEKAGFSALPAPMALGPDVFYVHAPGLGAQPQR